MLKILILGMMVLTASMAHAGESGGGGTLFQKSPQSQPVLLDYVLVNPDFQDSRRLANQTPLVASKFSKVVGFDEFDVKKQAAYALVKERLNLWRPSSPIVVSMVENALNGMVWRYTPHRVAVLPQYFIPQNVMEEDPQLVISGAILYTVKLGAWVSLPVWNGLGDMTQAGLMVHEGLRHTQLAYQMEISNRSLETLTAAIMLTNPAPGQTLDSAPYVDGRLLTDVDKSLANYRGVLAAQKEIREKLPALGSWKQDFYQTCKTDSDRAYFDKAFSDLEASMNAALQVQVTTTNYYSHPVSSAFNSVIENVMNLGMTGFPSLATQQAILDFSTTLDQDTMGIINAQFAANDAKLIDLGAQFNNFEFGLGEQALRDYVNGNRGGMSWSDRRQIGKVVKALANYNKALEANGTLIQ